MIRRAALTLSILGAGFMPMTAALAAPGDAGSTMMAAPPTLSSAAAYRLLAQAEQTAGQRDYANCIAIADANGNLLAFVRRRNTAPGCIEAAIAKARSAAANGTDTRRFYDLAKDQNVALGFIPGILPAVAGVVIHARGQIVGSIGIAGGPSDTEEEKFAAELRDQMERWLP